MTKAEAEERARAIAAVDRMAHAPVPCGEAHGGLGDPCSDPDGYARRHGLRPLKPPPCTIITPEVPASRRALMRDRKLGIVHDPTPNLTRDKVKPSASYFEDRDR